MRTWKEEHEREDAITRVEHSVLIGCYKKDVEPYIKAKFIGTEFDLPIVDFARE